MTKHPSRSTRRDFLQGKSAADAVHDLTQRIGGEPNTGAPGESRSYLIEVGRRAMACQFEVFLNAGETGEATDAAIAALDLIEELEDQLSIYRHRSEVSRLNAIAHTSAVPVEHQLFDLLQDSVRLFQETEGAFDITAGPILQAWSGLRREGRMPTSSQLQDALAQVGSHHIQLDSARHTVQFNCPGLSLNLGGIGKGYALDRAAEKMHEFGVSNYMIHGGSSSILARGHRRGGAGDAGWIVGIRDPLRAEKRLVELHLVDRAVGTSGAGTQQFYYRGKRYGHIFDPRTGQPADGILSSTVLAPRAAEADALATAFYILGVDWTQDYCTKHPEYSALLTTAGTRGGAVQLHPINCDGVNWRQITDTDSATSS